MRVLLHPPHHTGFPLHWGIKPSQDKELPMMPDKTIPCYICSWSHGYLRIYSLIGGLVPGSSEVVWLVDIEVLTMWLKTPSAPSVLSLNLPLGTLCSVQWLVASICLCTCQALAVPLRRQLYQAPISKHFLASASAWVWWLHMGWIPQWGSLWTAFPSVSAPLFVSVFPLDRSNSELIFLRWVGGLIPQLGIVPNLYI